MKLANVMRIVGILMLSVLTATAYAGGRYADPPLNLVEVQKAATQALEAAKQGNKEAALSAAELGRKLAITSFKEKSTMPMQIGSSRLKAVVASLEAGNVPETIAPLEEVVKVFYDEVEYYKKEGKI